MIDSGKKCICIQTQLTSPLMTWHTCLVHHKHLSDETGGNRDGHWEKPASFNFEEFLRGGEGKWGKIYLRHSTGLNKVTMEKYWYFVHGNTTTDRKNPGKNEADWCKVRGIHETGGTLTVLLWDKCDVFFNTKLPLKARILFICSHMTIKHSYLYCSALWAFCTSWTQRWWDRVLCPWVVSLRCAVSGSPDPIYNHRFCFS